MQELLRVLVALCWAQSVLLTSPSAEHKIHNIVLYPDKHSWCKTTEIKQIVAYPGCSSVEIDNNVCVGACFSYSIPRTSPSAPGEVITPYCDSCQPIDFHWKEVKLTCESDSDEEEEGMVEMIKKVQVITNCTCASCSKGMDTSSEQHRHIESIQADVPELMSLMMQHNQQEEEAEEEKQESAQIITQLPPTQNNPDLDNSIDVDDEKEKGKDEKGEDKIEIVQVNHKDSQGVHLVEGPHHSLVVEPDVVPQHHAHGAPIRHHRPEDDDEEVPSLLKNQFKVHDHEEYLDQIAVESRKEFMDGPAEVLSVPEIIYKEHSVVNPKSAEEKGEEKSEIQDMKNNRHIKHRNHGEERVEEIHGHHHAAETHHSHHHQNLKEGRKGVKIVEVPHHHLTPAVEGAQLSYVVKNEQEKE